MQLPLASSYTYLSHRIRQIKKLTSSNQLSPALKYPQKKKKMTHRQLNLLGRPENKWLDLYLTVILLASIVGFLSIKGLTNTCLFLLLAPSLFYLKKNIHYIFQENKFKVILPIIIALSLPIISIFLSQLGRQDWLMRAYDGPSRMLFSIPILFLLIYKKVDFALLLVLASPIALWGIALSVFLHPEVVSKELGRYATTFVRPNAFGTYTTVLTSFCLFNLSLHSKPSKLSFLYQASGLLIGLALVIGSGTRGSWLAIPFILTVWLLFNSRTIRPLLPWFLLLIITIYFLSSSGFFTYPGDRLSSGFYEIANWINHSDADSPTGLRLSIWKLSWQLFLHNPLFGYGNQGYAAFLNDPGFSSTASEAAKGTLACCGAHNELLANTLRSGITGTLSVLFLFLAPFILFAKNARHVNTNIAAASQLGLAYITCITICSISIEVFNLKYLSSFYGLVIAGLTAQIASEQNT